MFALGFESADLLSRRDLRTVGFEVAATYGFDGRNAEHFAQGYVHAHQGRNELVCSGSKAYDTGHQAGTFTQQDNAEEV